MAWDLFTNPIPAAIPKLAKKRGFSLASGLKSFPF
jgi:hypothetical protein